MPHPADLHRWFRLPSWSAILAASLGVVFIMLALRACDTLATQARIAALPNTIAPLEIFLARPLAWIYWASAILLSAAVALLALAQRHEARLIMRAAAAASLLIVQPLVLAGVLSVARRPSWSWLGADLGLLWFSVALQFRGEASPRLGDVLRLAPREAWGLCIIATDQLRRLAGFRYYPWSTPPLAAANGGIATRADLAAARGVMDLTDGLWLPAGVVSSSSREGSGGSGGGGGGGLVVCDPSYFDGSTSEESGIDIEDAPPGVWTVEVQHIRAIGDQRPRPMRARIMWAGRGRDASPELRTVTLGDAAYWTRERWDPDEVGAAAVDSGRLCIIDAAELRAAPPSPETGLYAEVESETGDITRVLAVVTRQPLGVAFTAGRGDGVYPVFLLREDGEPVGLLVDMTASIYNNKVLYPRRRGWREAKRPLPAPTP